MTLAGRIPPKKPEMSFLRLRRRSILIYLSVSFTFGFALYLFFLQEPDPDLTRRDPLTTLIGSSPPNLELSSYEFFGEQNIILKRSRLIGRSETRKKDTAEDSSSSLIESDDGPTVWVVTPTYYRPEQKAELTRMAQALLPNRKFIHWVLVYDRSRGTSDTIRDLQKFLERFALSFTILLSQSSIGSKVVGKPRGVGGRRAAISWLRKNQKEGVVYFADDDNTYDSDIFRQIRSTKKVTAFPVGLVTKLGVSSPIVKDGQVIGFYDGWKAKRKFPVDMAGFAINLSLFKANPQANMPFWAGYEEDELLRSLGVKMWDIVPLANNCTEILTWHTKTAKSNWPIRDPKVKPSTYQDTNLKLLLNQLPQRSLAFPLSTAESKQFSLLDLFFGPS